MNTHIDLNCDLGESFGRYVLGNDEGIMPFITSANIACGFHAGDAITIDNTLRLAKKHGLRIGAHPSYPDRKGFGRQVMQIPPEILRADIRYQISALAGMAKSHGMKLSYVKPHGALYNQAAKVAETAKVVIEAIQSMDSSLALMGLAGSLIEKIAKEKGIEFIREAFIDRRYTEEGKLLSRSIPGAVLTDIPEILAQIASIVSKQVVISHTGTNVPIQADSLCVHGDTAGAVSIAKAVYEHLRSIGCIPSSNQ